MKEFDVEVTRIGYGYRTIRVTAETEDEAINKALDKAGNYVYSEHTAEYEAQFGATEVDKSEKGDIIWS